ncbi:NlpC/P60 family protein [Streptomyces turgidiscabies]|uniref:NlpC/P60 family protein n=1 Tax=Streptomyces turgidiscabies (strain Car8) TaxID=698760 RepID=L7EUC6_STRT8|nr:MULTISPECIES: C40 family peptidase [Streptomyces]ELP62321.1 NlpC/P60 family protein [Streptomyces turgidiscabies Car8]MDX3499132.1 NlpC/P60 family protein [Streptomyces turgidiscabies]GAQ75558.1 putative endopeptidase precursor [Streptomyces turgidiscabies]
MAAHRKPRQRSLNGNTARTAATIALAGAATATGFDGIGHAEPQLTSAQVEAKVTRLYEEAEVATEKYNGAKEKAERAERRLGTLRDEAARKEERLNSAREALGSMAAAQYRSGGLDPALQLALSDDPDGYLDGAAFAERAGTRQASNVARVRKQLREIEQLRGAAHVELAALKSRQAELNRHKKTVTGKLGEARRLLSRLTTEERARLATEGGSGGWGHASRSSGSAREGLGAAGATGATGTPGAAGASGVAEAPNSRAAAAVAYAYQKLGSPYVWGATGPDAFDCSGLIQAAYRSAGISLPRTTYAQINAGQRVSPSELLPGDLVFFYSGISHVGIYVGNGQMIHAPNPSAPVRVAPLGEMPLAGATRVV